MKIIKNAEISSRVWNGLSAEKQEKLKKSFHLRPTNSGITIVSTYPEAAMRGVDVSGSEIELLSKLNNIEENLNTLNCQDRKKRIETLSEIGFKIRTKLTQDTLEEEIQAIMIRNMSEDKNLKERLGAQNKIQFIASEFIFERGKNRIDIIGFDGVDLYFFELKKDRTEKVEQVEEYVQYYSKKRSELEKILKVYPINPVPHFNKIHGVMVMQYAENSTINWSDKEKDHSIRILFYENSLAFHRYNYHN